MVPTDKQKALFITIEGPNGIGKTALTKELVNKLLQLNLKVYKTKEPTLSLLGSFLRKAEEIYWKETLACLAAADRYFHLKKEILPELSKGKIVISDRYIESSLVLQNLDGLEFEFIWLLNSRIRIPDMSVVLIASPEIIEERLRQRKRYSRFERTRTRTDEVKVYQKACKFLSDKGFNILILENGTTSLSQNIEKITQKILEL